MTELNSHYAVINSFPLLRRGKEFTKTLNYLLILTPTQLAVLLPT